MSKFTCFRLATVFNSITFSKVLPQHFGISLISSRFQPIGTICLSNFIISWSKRLTTKIFKKSPPSGNTLEENPCSMSNYLWRWGMNNTHITFDWQKHRTSSQNKCFGSEQPELGDLNVFFFLPKNSTIFMERKQKNVQSHKRAMFMVNAGK